MVRLVVLVFMFCISSCTKEDPMVDIIELKDRYLTCDSIKTTVDGVESTIIKGRGTGSDVTFQSNDSLIFHSVPEQQFQYYVRYSKVYYWPFNVTMHEGDYYKIAYKSGNHLNLEYKVPGTNNRTLYYFTAY